MKTKTVFFTTTIFCCCFLLFPIFSTGQNGSLDLSFGNGGKVITNIGNQDNAWSVAIQSDGKIVVAGFTHNGVDYDFALVRYNTNGTLDNSFGIGGIVTTDIDSSEYGYSVAIQPDGKIVVAGTIIHQDFALVRYNTDGTLDNTFGNGGKLISNITGITQLNSSIVIQSDGKIVLSGYIQILNDDDMVLIRYNANGTLDNSFGNGGIQTTDIAGGDDIAYSVALQIDGKIVICGASVIGANTHFAVLRYNTDGTLDNSFGNGGIQTTAYNTVSVGYSVAIQSDGKIVVGGMTWTAFGNNDFVLLRYNTNGILDNSFGNGGITISTNDSLDYCRSVALLSDGKILLGGRSKNAIAFDFRLDCYNTDGTLDNTFGNAGIVLTDITGSEVGTSLAIQSDDKIILVGFSNTANSVDIVLARYNYTNDAPDGISSIAGQTREIKSYPNPFSEQTTFHTDVDIKDATLLVYNTFGQQVKRLNHLYGREIKLYREGMPAGFYSFHLMQENKKGAIGRLIVVD